MNRMERILKAVNHEETDFTPYNLHAAPIVWKKLCRHYGIEENEIVDFVGNHIVKIGSDFNYDPWSSGIEAKLNFSGGPVYTNIDRVGGLHKDEFGCVWDRTGSMPHPVTFPLASTTDLENYRFPDPYRNGRFEEAANLADHFRDQAFIFGKLGMCLFERAWSIRGLPQLLIDMHQKPEFVEELLDCILYEWDLPIIEQQIDIGVDGFYFADDWGTNKGLMFSPIMWHRFIKPRLSIMYKRCRDAGLVVAQHSDGLIKDLFPNLIKIGLQVFNPLSTSLMNPTKIKEEYGADLAFYGGIEVKTITLGTTDDVKREIQKMIRIMSSGGYILQSSHTILEDSPIENVIAYVDEVRRIAGLDTT